MENQSEGYFGSTTYLDGQVLAVREGVLGKNKIRILARNNPYAFTCENCGKKASGMCNACRPMHPRQLV